LDYRSIAAKRISVSQTGQGLLWLVTGKSIWVATEEHEQKGPHSTSLPHLLHLGKLLKLKSPVTSKLQVSARNLFQLLTRQDINSKSLQE